MDRFSEYRDAHRSHDELMYERECEDQKADQEMDRTPDSEIEPNKQWTE